MRREAFRRLHDQIMANLCNATWFVEFLQKLRSQLRTTLTFPASCQTFLLAVKRVIEEGISITPEVFFRLLESCITEENDFGDIYVNKCIRLVREQKSCAVDAEKFLGYLRGRNINPSPALLAQIREQRKKAWQRENTRKHTDARKQMREKHSSSQLTSIGSAALLSTVNSRSDLDTVDDDTSLASDSSNYTIVDISGNESLKEVQ